MTTSTRPRKQILLVKDDAVEAANIAHYLSQQGWAVQTCHSAEEALVQCETSRPDCVVTDQNLPLRSGIDLLERLRHADPALKCIVVCGDDRVETAFRAMKAGAFEYIVKPVVMRELRLVVERAVGAPSVDAAIQAVDRRQRSTAKAAGPLRVLVAEDNHDAADTMRMLLEMSGYEVRVSPTGPAAVEAARQEPPDAILCDIGLPGLSGCDVVRTLRSDPRFAGVLMIAFTGYGDAQDRAATKSAGFDHHFVKTTDPAVILEELRKFASSRRRS